MCEDQSKKLGPEFRFVAAAFIELRYSIDGFVCASLFVSPVINRET